MHSKAGSTLQSASRPEPSSEAVRRAAVITHGKPDLIEPALTRLRRVAEASSVELLFPPDEAEKHGLDAADQDLREADLAVILGGDGTMLRALQRFLGTNVPVLGVNFGTIGFLTSIRADGLETELPRVFGGHIRVLELPTLDVSVGGTRGTAVNDVVITSSTLGRMVQLRWAVGGESLGVQRCDGVICATPTGSTGYNLSNGGPVMVWGLDAFVITFIAPHSLNARPLVAPRNRGLEVWNTTSDVSVSVLVDGHGISEAAPGERVSVRLGDAKSLLGTLPEATFFTRYRDTFSA